MEGCKDGWKGQEYPFRRKSQFTCGLKTIKVYMKETLPGGWHGTEKSKRFGMFRAQTVVWCDGEECSAK